MLFAFNVYTCSIHTEVLLTCRCLDFSVQSHCQRTGTNKNRVYVTVLHVIHIVLTPRLMSEEENWPNKRHLSSKWRYEGRLDASPIHKWTEIWIIESSISAFDGCICYRLYLEQRRPTVIDDGCVSFAQSRPSDSCWEFANKDWVSWKNPSERLWYGERAQGWF